MARRRDARTPSRGAVVDDADRDPIAHEIDALLGDPLEVDRARDPRGVQAVVPDPDVRAHHLRPELHEATPLLDGEGAQAGE